MELYAAVIRRRDWLDGKRGKAEGHGNADGDLGECALRDSQQDKRQQQQAKSNRSTHYAPLHLLILFHRPLRIRAAGSDTNLGYFPDHFRFLRFRVAAGLLRFEAVADARRWFRDIELCLGARLRRTGLGRRLWDEGFTFAATAPSVEPIERATFTRNSSSLAAGFRFFIFHS